MHHNIKLRIEYADAVLDGSKCFEIRLNDRGYQKGDTVQYQTVDREGNHVRHEVEDLEFLITYVLPGFHVTDGWVVFGTKLKMPKFRYFDIPKFSFFDFPDLATLDKMKAPDRAPDKTKDVKKPGDYPLTIGDAIYFVWVDADHGCLWRASDALVVSGIAYRGFFTSDGGVDPMKAGCFWKWDEFGVTAFRTREEAEKDAERRNTEEGLPRKANG